MYSNYLEGYDKLHVDCSPSRTELILRLEKQLKNPQNTPQNPLPTKLFDLMLPREKQHIYDDIVKRKSTVAKIKLQVSIMPFPLPLQKALYENLIQKEQPTPTLQQPLLLQPSSSQQPFQPSLLEQPLQQPMKKESTLQRAFQQPGRK